MNDLIYMTIYIIIKAILLLLMLINIVPVTVLIIIHILLTLPFYAYLLLKTDSPKTFVITAFVLDLILPFIGIVAVSTFYWLYKINSKKFKTKEQVLSLVEEELKEYKTDLFYKNVLTKLIVNEPIASYRPYIDIIRFGDINAKIDAIEKLSKLPLSRETVELLKMASTDEQYTIQLYAINALIKIEHNINSKVDILLYKLEQSPSDNFLKYKLGNLYFKIYEINIFSTEAGLQFLNKALTEYLSIHALFPNKVILMSRIFNIYLITKQFNKIIGLTDKLSEDLISNNPIILSHIISAYYNLKDYNSIFGKITKYKLDKKDYETGYRHILWWKEGLGNV